MAEKEERIKGVYFKDCNTKCDAVFDLTREEAIEKMANAILRVQVTDAEYCCNTFAEAALNALFEK